MCFFKLPKAHKLSIFKFHQEGKIKLNTTDHMLYFMVTLSDYGLLCLTYGIYIA